MSKAAQQEALVANNEATRLERDLAQARTAALANGMGVKSRLQALQLQLRGYVLFYCMACTDCAVATANKWRKSLD
jgi:hypothetical protein